MRRTLLGSSLVVLVIAALPACVVNVDREGYIEHDEKRFSVSGVTDLRLDTFSGAVEVRSWDRPEIVVDIEKRGSDRDAVGRIDVSATQSDNRIDIAARHSGPVGGFAGFRSARAPSARLTATVPRRTDLVIRTAEGSLIIERLDGKLDVRTGDGHVRAIETAGDLTAESGDGSIEVEDVSGRVDIRADDGSLRVSGTPSVLRAHTEDGSVVLRIRKGAVMSDDWLVSTRDGSISAELPGDFNADLEADPGSNGRTHNSLVLASATGGTRTERVLRGRIGSGGHTLQLQSKGGTIRLNRF